MTSKRLTVALMLPLLLAFTFAGSALGVEGKSIGAVSSYYGDVNFQHRGETQWNPAALGLGVFQYDTVKTEEKSKVRITFEDGSLFNLGESTQLEIREHIYAPEEARRSSLLAMLKGKMRVFCQKFAGRGSRFQVETPTAVIGIRGTEFIVWVVSNELTTVICLEDEVFVRNLDEKVPGEVILQPNQMTKIGVGVPPLPSTIVPEELRHQLEIDTAAYKIAPSSANPEMAKKGEPGASQKAKEEAQAAAGPSPMLGAMERIAAEGERAPSLPPFPQDPGESPEFKPPTLPEPPGVPPAPH